MTCPDCGSTASIVLDTRRGSLHGRATRRRRECPEGHRYTSYEITEPRDEVLEFINREKPCLTIRWC